MRPLNRAGAETRAGATPEPLTGWEQVYPLAPSTAGAWTPTPEQERAIARRSEPLLLSAGAGSGKTSVLVDRYVRAVCEDGIDPERILAITFTERAAAELRGRVASRLRASGLTRAANALGRAYVGTFHGFCAQLLRGHARRAGLPGAGTGMARTVGVGTDVGVDAGEAAGAAESARARARAGVDEGVGAREWEILDEGLAGRLRRRAFAEALGELLEGERVEVVDVIAAYGADRARAIVLGTYAQLRSRGQRLPRLPAPELDGYSGSARGGQGELSSPDELEDRRALDARAEQAVRVWDELLARFGERYELAKRSRAGLDFDDLELYALELLSGDPAVRDECAGRYALLMVDELQDVNPRQLALVHALERDNLFTVGDVWQSIYGFRHADVSLFRAREAQLAPLGQSLRLTRNFRAHAHLLQAVNAVFAPRFGATFTPLHPGRDDGDRVRPTPTPTHTQPLLELLLTHRRGWPATPVTVTPAAPAMPVTPVTTGSTAPWREAEAQALAERVTALVRSGEARPGGVAVLLRATGQLECYEQALRRQGLPTVASGGAFWTRQEVVDLLAHLRALADPADEVALYGVLSAPPLELSSEGLALLARAAREQGRGVWELAREPRAAGEVAELCAWLERERALAERLSLPELLERALDNGGRLDRLAQMPDGERRLANVRKLVELAGQWERTEGHDLHGFVQEAAWQAGVDGPGGPGGRLAGSQAGGVEPDALDPRADSDAVRLMSVHAAKGLEFDVVCLADLGRAPSASTPDLLVDGERVGVRMIELDDPEPRPALRFSELALQRRDAQAEEEDRILYVAMTRARERLLLSGAVDFSNWPRERPVGPPIAWLGPALAPELPGLCAEAAAAAGPAAGVVAAAGGGAAAAARLTGDGPLLAKGLTVDGTDVPLSLSLNMAHRSSS